MYRIQVEDENGNCTDLLGEYDRGDEAYEALEEYSVIFGSLEDVHMYKWSDFTGEFIEL